MGTGSLRFAFDAFEVDEAEARLARHGQPVALPAKAFAVLWALARHPGQLVTGALLGARPGPGSRTGRDAP
jgi:DNA-binding winged helix-turn-helix (wHTH) protein